jgi:hypothetical protein
MTAVEGCHSHALEAGVFYQAGDGVLLRNTRDSVVAPATHEDRSREEIRARMHLAYPALR